MAESRPSDTASRRRRSIVCRESFLNSLMTALVLLLVATAVPQTVVACGGPRKANSEIASPGTSAQPLQAEQAAFAADFVDSVGVQTHMSYVDTPYADWPRVMAELTRLGVHHIRDALPLNPAFIKGHQQLAAAGIRCTCGFGFDKDISAQEIIRAARAATDVEALEAPNECDAGNNCGGGGKAGIARVNALLPVLAEAGQVLKVPLIGPSFTRGESYASTGSIAQWITESNLHVYFGGRNPGSEGWGAGDARGHRYGSIDWWVDQSALEAPGASNVITETGYESFDSPTRPGTIPTDVEASYLVRTLLLAWNRGIRRTFIYELLDEFPGSGYGLLRHDFSEKPAFNALRNLLSILRDTAPSSKPASLAFSIGSRDPALSHALFQKNDGSYYLVLWIERSSYDAASLQRTPVASERVQVRLQPDAGVTETISFNGDGSAQSHKLPAASSTLTLDLDDHIQILRIASL